MTLQVCLRLAYSSYSLESLSGRCLFLIPCHPVLPASSEVYMHQAQESRGCRVKLATGGERWWQEWFWGRVLDQKKVPYFINHLSYEWRNGRIVLMSTGLNSDVNVLPLTNLQTTHLSLRKNSTLRTYALITWAQENKAASFWRGF